MLFVGIFGSIHPLWDFSKLPVASAETVRAFDWPPGFRILVKEYGAAVGVKADVCGVCGLLSAFFASERRGFSFAICAYERVAAFLADHDFTVHCGFV